MKEWKIRGAQKLNGRVNLIIELALSELEDLGLKSRQPGRFGR
ncbi:hypothetical protein [Hyphomicrobium denitrificans]|nr:hypothetical protein [Hyphomicrobium denitrificans]